MIAQRAEFGSFQRVVVRQSWAAVHQLQRQQSAYQRPTRSGPALQPELIRPVPGLGCSRRHAGGKHSPPTHLSTALNKETYMSTETNRHSPDPSPQPPSTELKASDFFPPGEGWNRDEKPVEIKVDNPHPDGKHLFDRNKH